MVDIERAKDTDVRADGKRFHSVAAVGRTPKYIAEFSRATQVNSSENKVRRNACSAASQTGEGKSSLNMDGNQGTTTFSYMIPTNKDSE